MITHDVRRIRTAFVLFASMTTIAAGCRDGKPPAVTEQKPAPLAGPPTVEVTPIVERPLDITLEMPGELDPYETVAVFPRVTGFVKTIRVDRGSRVKAGDVLIELEAPELVAQRAEAQSKVQSAEAQLAMTRSKAEGDAGTYERLKAAASTPGVVAGNDVVLAQKAVEANQSLVAAAERNVDASRQAVNSIMQMERYLRVTAPFDGIITERNVHPGALVGPGSGLATTPMVRLVNRNRLRLVVPVPEAYLAGVALGVSLPFTVPAYPGRTFSGQITRLSHEVDVKTRTMAVEIDVPNSDGRLAPGTFCQVRWPVRRQGPSLFAPSGSVASTTGRTFVVRVRDGRTEWVDVKTGLSAGALVEVFGDLRAGDQVATRGTDELRPGTEVKPKAAQPPS